MKISIPNDCLDCRFHHNTEGEEDWCCLFKTIIEKDEESLKPIKPPTCSYECIWLKPREVMVVCEACSKAGGAGRAVYHLPPVCGS